MENDQLATLTILVVLVLIFYSKPTCLVIARPKIQRERESTKRGICTCFAVNVTPPSDHLMSHSDVFILDRTIFECECVYFVCAKYFNIFLTGVM